MEYDVWDEAKAQDKGWETERERERVVCSCVSLRRNRKDRKSVV